MFRKDSRLDFAEENVLLNVSLRPYRSLPIDESHNAENWCIMAVSNFKHLSFVKSGMNVAQIL